MISLTVIGPGGISRRFLQGMAEVSSARVTSFVSRNPSRCAGLAEEFRVETIGSLEEILSSGTVQAAYIAVPNHVHAQTIRACLSHGIHVLCEKPITLTHREYLDLLAEAHDRRLVLMEAQKALYTPVFKEIRSLLEAGTLGNIQTVEAGYCRNNRLPDDSWRMCAPGKGALYDVGCYPISVLFGLFGCDLRETGRSETFKNDTDIGGMIRFSGSGMQAEVRYSMTEDGLCDLNIIGSKGELHAHEYWKSDTFSVTVQGRQQNYAFPFASEFAFETSRFIERIENKEYRDQPMEKITAHVLKILER